ncbi:response regulator [Fluviispira multicolorata]|uniref:Tetratricopeptide repeat protein n=1 Tax=Fluviispira multicolorata TaxID=2654512 RepID=A0A833N0L9_9BACT|nr:response regulator [Fluviispira multicolorata]KAB8029061.1 tetratricopeptide repeat protein [Fluviispira multicolorata]
MTQSAFNHIMVVDDDPDILSQVEKIFVKLGIGNYKTFLSAEKALKELEVAKESYDMVIVDVRMPIFAGIALVQYIKTHVEKKIRDTFCVPLVGSIGREDKAILSEFSFFETVSKPIAEKAFIVRLGELGEQHKNPNSDKNFQTHFNNALIEKKYKQAEDLILPRLKQDPKSLRFLTLYAELLLRAQQAKKAEEFLNKVLKIDQNHIVALNLMSKVYIKTNRFDDAMKVLEKAKIYSPHNIDRLLVMGELHLGSGEADKAEENFNSVLKLNPTDERATYGLGRALATQGKTDESKKILASLKKGVELASFFNNKGILLVKAGKYNDGISLYKNAIKVLDDQEREHLLLYNIALAYSKLGDSPKALDFAKKASEKAPKENVKPKKLLEKLQKETKSDPNQAGKPQEAQTTEPSKEKYLLTGSQMDFIMGGYDEVKAPEPSPNPASTEEEFITFGN